MKPDTRTKGSCATCIHSRTRGADGRTVNAYAGNGPGFCAKPGASIGLTFIPHKTPDNTAPANSCWQ